MTTESNLSAMMAKLSATLKPHQMQAIQDLSNGKILYGGVGVGKSLTVVGYYLTKEAPRDVIVITTAKKRDTLDWDKEFARFGISTHTSGPFGGTLTVDSWNNIAKHESREDAFFIFDEQRLVGNGAWVKSFQRIARRNRWVLLTATPGDTWIDYVPVFVANGLFRNASEFKREHVVYAPFAKYPRIVKYLEVPTLEKYRNMLLVEMPFEKHTERIIEWVTLDYDLGLYGLVTKRRWNIYEDRPLKDASEMSRCMRRVVNSDPSRTTKLGSVLSSHSRVIVYYNFDYELMILRDWCYQNDVQVAEWNGHRHQDPPSGDGEWLYLVQYMSGAEGWNCTTSDAVCFFSLTYSYRTFEQAQGRIDRMDTPFTKLYYYVFTSDSTIDRAIRNAVQHKKIFNERTFGKRFMPSDQGECSDELGKKYGILSRGNTRD
jgi:hypothetical protein